MERMSSSVRVAPFVDTLIRPDFSAITIVLPWPGTKSKASGCDRPLTTAVPDTV